MIVMFRWWIEGDFSSCQKEDLNILEVITEKKNYSSYTGGIYVNRNNQLEDILKASEYIQKIVALPKKEHAYSL
ncbi:hypothetical protein CON65_11180 [Bacillus pseudomycoides]|uniref:Uncharacterized protein n=1 Tax=Bacillus pseudomycoides TaxID=64104 RepID=A0AA91VC53_9BACI|nr:hypothetical protein COO03_25920 [Bacillus sp. AFS098217]PED82517.1 hypothetical protein CON65_11180 [Bacillus pseudomycoides]PEU11519.1 hypothetical protein CN525_21940 [Bacillus sp. AFS014408]PEU17289.1 hypothetical protein CN524_02805 [Bacillus sp. AFS019443]PFW60715.1 hypothetical protein COL20_20700 [Bacillus sp. AFS075034]